MSQRLYIYTREAVLLCVNLKVQKIKRVIRCVLACLVQFGASGAKSSIEVRPRRLADSWFRVHYPLCRATALGEEVVVPL